MKTKLLFSLLALAVLVSAFGQRPTIELSFTALYDGQSVPLDSILIENLSQGGDTTLYSPDDILVLDYITSVSDKVSLGETSFSVSQNYPNPFKDQTTINIHMPKKEKIVIHIRDILGREMTSYEEILNVGNHTFTFYPGNEKCYLLTICGATASKTIKMIVATGSTSYTSSCKMVYTSYNETWVGFKSQKANGDFVYLYGDTLRYTGFALTVNDVNGSDVIEDAPLESEDYDFDITEGIPCPGIPWITYEDQVYNTVQIGDQCWIKENMNVGTMILGGQNMEDNEEFEKYCYDDSPANCIEYGGLYQWHEMMQYTMEESAQGICPSGWHIPSDDEWKILEGTVDSYYGIGSNEWENWGNRGYDAGVNLKSIDFWIIGGEGLDVFGFRGLAAGWGYGVSFDYGGLGTWCSFWVSSINISTNKALGRNLFDSSNKVNRNTDQVDSAGSVRCLKD